MFLIAAADTGVGKGIFLDGSRNDLFVLKRVMRSLSEHGVRLPREPVFVDVGANIGTTVVAALRRHGFGSGVALEPSPGNFRLLRANLALNGLDSCVEALPLAAGGREGQLLLDISATNSGGHRIVTRNGSRADETVTVRAVTLDRLVARGIIDRDRVGLLWIDVQGFEETVLNGASVLLEAGVPFVTAIRPGAGDLDCPRPRHVAPEARAALLAGLTESYTDVVKLREKPLRSRSIQELGAVIGSFRHAGDILLLRR